jgi:hypothetical protein
VVSDPTDEPTLEQRLGQVLRGVQRMADGLGALEQQLPELATGERLKALSDRVDEYRVRSRAEIGQVADVVTALGQGLDVVLRDQQALAETVRRVTADPGALDRLTEAVRALRDDLAESHRQLRTETAAMVERVAGEQATRAMRIHEAIGEAGERTVAAFTGVTGSGDDVAALAADLRHLRTTLDGRHVVVTEAISSIRQEMAAAVDELRTLVATPVTAPAVAPVDDGMRALVDGVRDDLRRLEGEILAGAGQLRTDVGARQAELRDEVVAALDRRLAELATEGIPGSAEGIYNRLGGIEWRLGERLDPLAEQLAGIEARIAAVRATPDRPSAAVVGPDPAVVERLAAIEAGVAALRRDVTGELGQVAQRDDLRRGVDRVLGAVTGAEHAVTGEIRAVDARVGAMADDVRTVRALRDGLDALADGIDGVRQLATRSATSQQMTEVIRELAVVLNEIDSARSQVLRVEQSTTPVAADVVAVGGEVDELGRRIDQLAEVIEERIASAPAGRESPAAQLVAERLRQVSESARQIGNGMLEDLRARRNRKASGQ